MITALSPVNPLRCACARHNRSTRVQCGFTVSATKICTMV
ncbi:Uncharacterised protein [Vibrio cholerae]|nr:Uncharacterised protein [Vibrio cholerae]